MPNFLKPLRSAFSSTFWQLYQLLRWVWCAKPSNCVPTWPSSVTTISSFDPRMLENWFMNVRLVCTSKRRVPKNGMLGPST